MPILVAPVPAPIIVVRSLEFFDEVALDNNFDSRAEVALPAEGVGINVSGALTYEFWLAPSATAGDNPASTTAGANNNWINSNICLDRDLRDTLPAHGFGISAGQICFGVSTAGGERTIIGTTDLRDGAFHFVRLVRDGDNIHAYVAGTREATGSGIGTGSIAMPDSHTPLLTCGPSQDQDCVNSDPFLVLGTEKHELAANGFIGLIAELRVSNIARSTGASHTVPSGPMANDANTVGLWRMAEQQGTTVADESGNNQTMNIVADANGPQWNAASPY
jgi:hypothetical protein